MTTLSDIASRASALPRCVNTLCPSNELCPVFNAEPNGWIDSWVSTAEPKKCPGVIKYHELRAAGTIDATEIQSAVDK